MEENVYGKKSFGGRGLWEDNLSPTTQSETKETNDRSNYFQELMERKLDFCIL